MSEPRRIGPVGGLLSQAVIHDKVITTSGQVADDPSGLSVADEVRAVLAKIDALLAEGGTDRRHLLSATVYLSDMAHLEAMNAEWATWVVPEALPTRTTIQTPMTRPEWRVAISVSARIPG